MAQRKTHKVVSTLEQSVGFAVYEKDAKDNPIQKQVIHITGGANVWDGVCVPSGYGVAVSDDQLEVLRKNPVFVNYEKKGLFTVVKINENQDKIIDNMDESKTSAQRTPSSVGKDAKVINKNGEILVEVAEKSESNKAVEIASKSVRKKAKK